MSIFMYDTAAGDFRGGIPDDAQAIAFYTDANFRNEGAARARFPHLFQAGHVVGLTALGGVGGSTNGVDFEPGNWMGDVGRWVSESRSAGIWRPVVYADGSDMAGQAIPSLEAHYGRPLPPPGPGRPFRLWVANPDGVATVPDWADAKQHWWGSIQGHGNVDMDISVTRDDFFIQPPAQEDMMALAAHHDSTGRLILFVEDKNGNVFYTWQDHAGGTWFGGKQGVRVAGWQFFAPAPA